MVFLGVLGQGLEQLVVSLDPLDIGLVGALAVLLKHLVAVHLGAAEQLVDVLVGLGAAGADGDPAKRADAVGDHGEGVFEGGVAVGLAELVRLLHVGLQALEEFHDGAVVGLLGLVGDAEELALGGKGGLDGLGLALDDGAQLAAQGEPCLELRVGEVVEGGNRGGQALDGGGGGGGRGGGRHGGCTGDGHGGRGGGGRAISGKRRRGNVFEARGGCFEPADDCRQHVVWRVVLALALHGDGARAEVEGGRLGHGVGAEADAEAEARQRRGTHRLMRVVKLFMLFWAMAAAGIGLWLCTTDRDAAKASDGRLQGASCLGRADRRWRGEMRSRAGLRGWQGVRDCMCVCVCSWQRVGEVGRGGSL